MHDTLVTLQGHLGGEVRFHETAKGPVAHFRVGASPSWLDRSTGEWVNGETTWYSVTAWRGLARNCAESLRRGDAVVVHGRLTLREWTSNGAQGQDLEVNAVFVGHDLNRGRTTFTRVKPAASAAPAATTEPGGLEEPGLEPGRPREEAAGAAA
jgi:single-strand DNA-binding protein